MFRKSVSFFILLALLWLALWHYVSDSTPEQFSFIDVVRLAILLCSLMASAFAVLLLVIRYKGLEIASNFIPYAGLVSWLGKHAYHYSQPKTTIQITYTGPQTTLLLTIKLTSRSMPCELTKDIPLTVDLGFITKSPQLQWHDIDQSHIKHQLPISVKLKRMGKNMRFNITLNDQDITAIESVR